MLDVVAIMLAEERTADLARRALPDSPLRPDRETGRDGERSPRLLRARRPLGPTLHRLADLAEPVPRVPGAGGGESPISAGTAGDAERVGSPVRA